MSVAWSPRQIQSTDAAPASSLLPPSVLISPTGIISGESFGAAVLSSGSPASIANLALWFDGRASAFSDSGGTVPAIADAGRVARIDQPSPLTGSWLAASDAVRPYREANCLDFQMISPLCLQQPVGITLPANNFTIALAFEQRAISLSLVTGFPSGSSGSQRLLWGTDGVGVWGLYIFQDELRLAWNGNVFSGYIATSAVMRPGSRVVFILRGDGTGARWTVVINGVQSTGSQAASFSGTIASLNLGGDPSLAKIASFTAIAQCALYSRAVSDGEVTTLTAFMAANMPPAGFPLGAPLMGLVGDSIASGQGGGSQGGWAGNAQASLRSSLANPPRMMNSAISGYTVANAITDYPLVLRQFVSLSRAKNILFVAVGTNSMTDFAGLSAATVLSQVYSLCDTARADGWQVVLCTVLPRSDPGMTGFEAKRTTINTDFRGATGASHSDAICDFAAISGMGAVGDSDNTTFYSVDHVHPNNAGHALMAQAATAAALTLLP